MLLNSSTSVKYIYIVWEWECEDGDLFGREEYKIQSRIPPTCDGELEKFNSFEYFSIPFIDLELTEPRGQITTKL